MWIKCGRIKPAMGRLLEVVTHVRKGMTATARIWSVLRACQSQPGTWAEYTTVLF